MSLKLYKVALIPLSMGLLLSGCGSTDAVSGASQSAIPATNWDTLGNLMNTEFSSCGSCHAPGKSQKDGPDMSNAAAFRADMVGKKLADYPNWPHSSTCSQTVNFITAGSSLNSTLLAALDQNASDALGAKKNCTSAYFAHKGKITTLGSNGIANITSWIQKGAFNN